MKGNFHVRFLEGGGLETARLHSIGWQMHNRGLFDKYKEITIEVDPVENDLITVK